MSRREVVLLAVLAGCGTVREPVVASGWAEAEAERPLGRADCVHLAVDSAPTAAAWRARLGAAEARLRQAGTLPNPTLLAEWEDFGLTTAFGALVQQTYSLGYSLADLFARGGREEIARHELRAVAAELLAERRRLAIDVSTAYDELVAARRAVTLAGEVAALAERARAATERRAAAGVEAPIVLDRAAAEVAEARAAVATAEATAAAQELAFAFALGFRKPVPLALADDLDLEEPPSPEELAARAAERPELLAAEARYRASLSRLDLAASRVQFLPRVGAGYRTLAGEDLAVASLEVELPVFDAGGAAIAEGDAELLGAAAELRKAALAVAEDVAAAAQRSAAARAYLERHARPLAAQRSALRDRSARLFEAGESTFDELLAASRDEVRARSGLLDAELAASAAGWSLRIDALLEAWDPAVPEPGGRP